MLHSFTPVYKTDLSPTSVKPQRNMGINTSHSISEQMPVFQDHHGIIRSHEKKKKFSTLQQQYSDVPFHNIHKLLLTMFTRGPPEFPN